MNQPELTGPCARAADPVVAPKTAPSHKLRRLGRIGAAAILVSAASVAAAGVASAPPAHADPGPDRLCEGGVLGQNQAIFSHSQKYQLTYQSDGNPSSTTSATTALGTLCGIPAPR
jgi:hypothetical protein